MANPPEIDSIGERIAASALVGMGYQTNVDARQPGSTEIEAIQNDRKLLVQVKTAVVPDTPSQLSSEEERNIKSRATKLGCEPYEAKVQLDDWFRLVGKIEWRNLA